MSRSTFTVTVARTRGGRALLHALCLARGRNVRWHVGGIVRELFGSHSRQGRTQNRCLPPTMGLWLLGLIPPVVAVLALGPAVAAGADSETVSRPALAAPAAPPAFHLLSLAQVDGSGVFLHQIATATGLESGGIPIRVASPPAFGRALTLTRDQISAALQTVRPDLAGARWTGADLVRLTRRHRLLAESELRDLLTSTLQSETVKDKGEL